VISGTATDTSRPGITFGNPVVFYAGCVAIVVGVLLHLPMFISAASMNYVLAGMPIDPAMLLGMALIVVGLVAATYGIWPSTRARLADSATDMIAIAALDDIHINRAHLLLMTVLAVALIVDVMKPASLGFVVPGMLREYQLSRATVALLPLVALIGTAIGSLLWGWLGDRIGRRATILLSAIFFCGTAICGAMPAFGWNVFMCLLMGTAAGGMLPIAFSLLSEFIPARRRAALVVLLGGLGTVGGYLAASSAAALLEPHFGWRVMWFLNLPTGLLLIVLNRYIPESPRFLLLEGRIRETGDILKHFGATIIRGDQTALDNWNRERLIRTGLLPLFRRPFIAQTVAVSLYGLAWGLVNFGFLLWLPTNLRNMGLGVGASDALIAKSSLLALPGAILMAWLYSRWSSKKSMMLIALFTAGSLIAISLLGATAIKQGALLVSTVVVLLVCSSGMTAMLSPYSAEVYPTRLRSTGSGLAAGSGKFGGILGQGAAVAHLAPSLALSSLIVAAPVLFSIAVLAAVGIETRGRRLEDIHGRAQVDFQPGVAVTVWP
jgi:MFS transporter, putative metabolite:H+ symporter